MAYKWTKNGYPYFYLGMKNATTKEGVAVDGVFTTKMSLRGRKYILTVSPSDKEGVDRWLTVICCSAKKGRWNNYKGTRPYYKNRRYSSNGGSFSRGWSRW